MGTGCRGHEGEGSREQEMVPDGAASGIKKRHQRWQPLPLRRLNLAAVADAFGSASPASVTDLRTG